MIGGMATQLRRAAAALVVVAAGIGCTPTGAYTCQSSVSCRGTPVQTCCTTTECEYRHEGVVTPCAGTNCVAAAALVLADCPCLDASGIDLDATLDAGLDASGCVR